MPNPILIQIPPYYAIYGTLGAAVIAACASLTSAYVSFKTKDREFRNDYYKKIIDKRLSAYQKVEGIIFQLSKTTSFTILKNGKPFGTGVICNIFQNHQDFIDFLASLKDCLSHSVWLSHDFINELGHLHENIINSTEMFGSNPDAALTEEQLAQMGTAFFDKVDGARLNMEILIRQEIMEIQDVKKFFSSLLPK